jgi:hypothetical protein
MIIELAEVWAHFLDVGHTPEHLQEVHGRLLCVPGFKQRHAVERTGGRPIQQEDDSVYRLSPEVSRHVVGTQNAPRCPHDHLVPPFEDVILLWRA